MEIKLTTLVNFVLEAAPNKTNTLIRIFTEERKNEIKKQTLHTCFSNSIALNALFTYLFF